MCLCNWILSANEANQDHNDGDNQQNVDETAYGEGSQQPQEPQDNQDNSDGVQHKVILLLIRVSIAHLFPPFYLNAKAINTIVKALRITSTTFCEVGGRGFHKI